MRIADRIVEILIKNDLEDVFMVTGGAAMHLNDAFTRNKQFNVTFFHNEQACVMAADAYARVKNKPAIVCVTAGPGGANTINGLFGAWTDSLPVVIISGQVRTNTLNQNKKLRQLGDQEIDITKIVNPITKLSTILSKPQNVDKVVQNAVSVSISNRRGPVWIDVPIDIQGKEVAFKEYKIKTNKGKKTISTNNLEKFKKLKEEIKNSKRPVILAGNGIHLANQKKSFIKFINKLNIPVVTAFNGHDLLWESNEKYCGRAGTIGDRSGNIIVECSDLLLVLGSRLNIRQIGYNYKNFAKDTFFSMVDIDNEELHKKTLNVDLPINSDLKDFFNYFNKESVNLNYSHHKEYLNWSKKIKNEYGIANERYKNSTKINPYLFARELSKQAKSSDIIVTSDATACLAPFQAFEVKKGQRMFTNSGSGSMGFGLPAAIGASIASNSRVICFEGDGSLQMNIQELATVSYNKLNILIIVMENNGYHSIRQSQKNYFSDNLAGFDKSNGIWFPNLEKIADAYKIKYKKINNKNIVGNEIKQILNSKKGPLLCEVMVNPNQNFQPRVTSRRDASGNIVSAELYDMHPFLNKNELEEILKVKKTIS